MKRKVTVLINTRSGRINPSRAFRIISESLAAGGMEFSHLISDDMEQLTGFLREKLASGCHEVFVLGGDGTISALAKELVGRDTVLSILPGGTGNILARQLGIPLSLKKALKKMTASTETERIDALETEDRFLFLNLSIGMSSVTITRVPRGIKKIFGLVSYIAGLIVHLARQRPRSFHAELDGQGYEFFGREFLITNIGFGGTPLGPLFDGCSPFDGRMECSVFTFEKPSSFLHLLRDVIAGTPRGREKYLRLVPFRESITAENLPPLPVQGDGETLPLSRIRGKIHPGAVAIRLPGSG